MNPPDFGPFYTETRLAHPAQFPIEPWNTASNLIFLYIVIYFASITRLNGRKYPLMTTALPLLLIGFIGGTIYHATRSDRIWLVMDWGPIMVLSLLASVFFISIATQSRIKALFVPVIFFTCFRSLLGVSALPMGMRISIGYAGLALLILVPAYMVSKIYSKDRRYLVSAALFFVPAILFRYVDPLALLPMGTHFLWHSFGGMSVWCLMKYIVTLEAELYNKRAHDNQLAN